ncbi:MAG: Wzy polymerase domain-containing protein [Hydrogenophaga sp.]|nr:Wzy polymerase domain-containing protein [Hydrogenophaga sp.]
MLAAAAAAAVLFGMGRQAGIQPRITEALVTATVLAMVFNVAASWLQFFDVERTLSPLVNLNPTSRAFGNFRQSNHLGTFAVLGLLGTWWRHRRGMDSSSVTVVLAFLAYSGVALSASRTAALEVVAVAVCLAFWSDRRSRFDWLLFVAGPLWVWLLGSGLQSLAELAATNFQPLEQREDGNINVRLIHWGEAWQLALKHPFFGVGWGELGRARFEELSLARGQVNTLNAHNIVLHVLAEFGLLGGTLILAPVLALLWRLRPWALAWSHPQPHQLINLRWGWLVLVAVGLHSLAEYPLWYMPFIIPTVFVFGMLIASHPRPVNRTVPAGALTTVSAAMVLATALALVDYHRVSTAFGPRGASLPDPTLVMDIQDTVLFRHYADRAWLERIPMTPDHLPQTLAATERLLTSGPNTLLLWVRLAALCESKQLTQAQELAHRFETLFPEAHAKYAKLKGPEALQRCGL